MTKITNFDPVWYPQSSFHLSSVTSQILEDIGASHFAFEVATAGVQGVSLGVACSDKEVSVSSLNAIQRPVEASKAVPNIDIAELRTLRCRAEETLGVIDMLFVRVFCLLGK